MINGNKTRDIYYCIRRNFLFSIDNLISISAPNSLSDEMKLKINSAVMEVEIVDSRFDLKADFSTNLAFILYKFFADSFLSFANKIKDKLLENKDFSYVTVSDNGFINFSINDRLWNSFFYEIISQNCNFDVLTERNKSINIEFVSANPTGPLHIGHTRNAVLLDVLANVYTFYGYEVCREYYVNDMGSQIITLLDSCYLRYKEALGHDIDAIPQGLYPGDYLKKVGKYIVSEHGNSLLNLEREKFFDAVKDQVIFFLLKDIKKQLLRLGIKHDNFVFESSLHKNSDFSNAFRLLKEQDLIYESNVLTAPKGGNDAIKKQWVQRKTTLFRSTNFGDDEDRILQKDTGEPTYFASDIAYHFNKVRRDFDELIIGLGEDHKGYVKRIKGVVTALTDSKKDIKVKISNIVNFVRGSEPVKMSKRAGNFLTLQNVLDEVPKDSVRYTMISRRSDVILDFDFDKFKEQNKHNPVFYVQYAYVRICSVLRKVDFDYTDTNSIDVAVLNSTHERRLMRLLARFLSVMETVFKNLEPHLLTVFVYDIAESIHSLWNVGVQDNNMRFIIPDDEKLTKNRISLLYCAQIVMGRVFEILGLEALERM
ncbi:arginine--tRNA ligase [Anaplasmataceae bacterium AB001_6]|nr:arginine--tRNA ligase [Anaplasmataceae bacterium AB001_6]